MAVPMDKVSKLKNKRDELQSGIDISREESGLSWADETASQRNTSVTDMADAERELKRIEKKIAKLGRQA